MTRDAGHLVTVRVTLHRCRGGVEAPPAAYIASIMKSRWGTVCRLQYCDHTPAVCTNAMVTIVQ